MPQVVNIGRKKLTWFEELFPVKPGDEQYAETRDKDRLEFDPTRVFQDTEDPIYDLIFNPIESAFKDIVGRPLDLSKGDPYAVVFDPEENTKIEEELSKFISPIRNLIDKDPNFSANIYGERRELFERDFGKELYGLKKYIETHPSMPPEGSSERTALDTKISEVFASRWGNIKHMISSEIANQGVKHSVDESHALGRAGPAFKKIS